MEADQDTVVTRELQYKITVLVLVSQFVAQIRLRRGRVSSSDRFPLRASILPSLSPSSKPMCEIVNVRQVNITRLYVEMTP